MSRIQKTVLACAILLFLTWLGFNLGRLTADTDREVCLVLGILFSLAILIRPKIPRSAVYASTRLSPWWSPVSGVAGLAAALPGIVFGIHQLEWIGLLLILYSCMRWSLPSRFACDILPALAVLYFIHPLPWLVVGQTQLAMQDFSVRGAEWLLHCVNVPAWADGYTIRGGTVSITVPAACSGMTTAITVLLSCIGTGLFFRLPLRDFVLILPLGLVQTLMLNILRVAATLILAPRMSPEWASTFLHDSLWAFLLASIVFVQIEIAVLLSFRAGRKKKETAIAAGVLDREDKTSIFHPFWKRFQRNIPVILSVLLLITIVSGALYKRRPYHRSRMILRVANELSATSLANAERVTHAALKLDGTNLQARRTLAHILTTRGKYDLSLAELDKIPPKDSGTEEIVTRAQNMTGKRQYNEASSLMDSLSPEMKKAPGVAMVAAEIAAAKGDIKTLTESIVIAADIPSLLKRVRALFPYLASKEQWKTIVLCDRRLQYDNPVQAATVIEAYYKSNDMANMGKSLRRAITQWPQEPVFLNRLLSMSILRPKSDWEGLFAQSFLSNLAYLNTDQLATYLQYCFSLRRPDLAWIAYARLRSIDPRDPSLYLAVSRFAESWFLFRMQYMGLGTATPDATIDMKTFVRNARNQWPFMLLVDQVPFSRELCDGSSKKLAEAQLTLCLDELSRREKENQLNLRMQMTYLTALTMSGRHADAQNRLSEIEKQHPEEKAALLYKRVVLYDIERDWENAYEAARQYASLVAQPDLTMMIVQIDALVNLKLGIYAYTLSERLLEMFPESLQAAMTSAMVLDAYGFKEDALFTLEGLPGGNITPMAGALITDTERFASANPVARLSGSAASPGPAKTQKLFLQPAELLIIPPPLGGPLNSETMDREADQLSVEARASVSPFIRSLRLIIADWLRQRGNKASSDPEKWFLIGRDEVERAVSLHELAMLLVRQQNFIEADKVLSRATQLMPDSAALWLSRISLSKGSKEVVQEARRTCPGNADIWVADMVMRTRELGPGDWALREIEQVTGKRKYPPGALVRAGDFLLRSGMTTAAAMAARDAIKNCDGLLPAYTLGLRCALTMKDMDWALACAKDGSKCALDPKPFYKAIVDIETAKGTTSTELANALERLRASFPNDTQWPERLASLYFKRGNIASALDVLSPLIAANKTKELHPESLIIAAEAARMEGRNPDAIRILSDAREKHPIDISLLNNLIYVLAQNPATVGRAKILLPELLSAGGELFAHYDTAAVVYLRAGDLQLASKYMGKALELVQQGDYAWDEVYLNAAEINSKLGRYSLARQQLDIVRSNRRRSTTVENRRREILETTADAAFPDKGRRNRDE